MRTLEIGSRHSTEVVVLDEPGEGGACHHYVIIDALDKKTDPVNPFAEVLFQDGPIKEADVNGCHHEDLIAIVIDRLEHFQKGDFECAENNAALAHLYDALEYLNQRTKDREKRGVEGTKQV